MEENAEEDVHVEVADMSEIDNSEVIDLIEGKPTVRRAASDHCLRCV